MKVVQKGRKLQASANVKIPTVGMVIMVIIGMGMVVAIGVGQPIGETHIPKTVGKVEIIGTLIQVGQRITRTVMFKKYATQKKKKRTVTHLLWTMLASLAPKDKKLRTHQNVRKLITN